MVDPVEMGEHGDPRVALHAGDQALAAARNDQVYRGRAARPVGRKHGADRGTIRDRHELCRIGRNPGGDKASDEGGMDRAVAFDRFGAAAQDDGIARHHRQRRRIGGHVRAAFVDDPDHADRHAHPAQAQTVGPLGLVDRHPDRIGEAGDRRDPVGHCGNARRVESQTIQQRRRQAGVGRLRHVDRIGGDNLLRSIAERLHPGQQSARLHRGRQSGERSGRGARARGHICDQGDSVRHRRFAIRLGATRQKLSRLAAGMICMAAMSGEIGAAGDIATGLLVGRAIEPHAGEHGPDVHEHGLCLNCGTALHGDFCHACGQAGHVHRTLTSIGHDLLHGVFHLEGKIWRTLPMLLTRPGELTRRYIAGERARFVSPLALFLFSVFLMFATIHTFDGDVGNLGLTPKQQSIAVEKIDKQIVDAKANLAAAEAAQKGQHGGDTPQTVDARSQLKTLVKARGLIAPAAGSGQFYTKWPALDKGIAKVNANPGLALYKFQSSAYKYSWALIPISVPFVALLFLWKPRYKLYDHAIFVTYSLSFMMFLVVVLSLCLTIDAPGWIFGTLLAAAPPVHMFVQLRGAYALRRRSALWRTIALLVFAWVALIAFVMLLLVMGLME